MPTAAQKKLKARVRMYRLALGDCFLLSFGQKKFDSHFLIDCGTLKGSPRTDALPAVIADISETSGRKLNAVAVTHEHWDHLSAFAEHPELFEKIGFEAVWLPWTEDPNDPDPVAQQLRERFEPGLRAMGLAGSSDPAVQGLLGFYGFDDGGALGAAGGKISMKTRAARDYVLNRKLARQPFLSPGNVLEPVPGLRVYVLGPPRSRKQLARDQPRAGETFEMSVRSGVNAALGAALLQRFHATGEQDPETIDHYYPFDRRYRAQSAEEQAGPEFKSVLARYREEPYRQIDDDWLSGAAELALQMDSDTNNASLVLAFELVASGKVLLFPGDAQVGNWESWHDVEFNVNENGGKTKKVTAEDLLRRTVLYKVGHHGSHNATRKPGGLESMTSPELVAMIPTDAEFALGRRPHPWHMPAPGLGAELEKRTQGRVLRADSEFPQTAAQKKKFKGRVNVTDLFVEYEIED